MKFKTVSLFLTIFLILAIVPIAFADDGEDGEINAFCMDLNGRRHPVGGRIADIYDIEYSRVMEWFCDQHFGFGEIILALQTSRLSSDDYYTPEVVLQMKTDLGGWGQVWKSLGYTGRPKAERPAWAGPKDIEGEETRNGPPAWAGPKEKDDDEGRNGPPPWAGPKVKSKPNGKKNP
jgi:hypothetical protein